MIRSVHKELLLKLMLRFMVLLFLNYLLIRINNPLCLYIYTRTSSPAHLNLQSALIEINSSIHENWNSYIQDTANVQDPKA